MFTAEKARLAECGNTSRVCAVVRNFSKEFGLGTKGTILQQRLELN